MTSGPDFSKATKRTLANRAGQVCSNPKCRKPTSGPHSDESKAVNLGEAAHIRAARPDQARYDASMTDKERAAISNGIWLCKECARRIDVDEAKYPVPTLAEWKNTHEKWISGGKPATQETGVPLVDIELTRVTASPEFAQLEIQFAYDIFLQNKSNLPISHIQVSRSVDPQKNRQKIAIHPNAQGKIAPFHKKINVLAPGERKKIYREHSSSYEFSRFSITYKDEYGKRYHCVLEGDRDCVYLKSNYEIFSSKNKE